MATTIRQSIVTAILTQLALVTTANGYETTVGTVGEWRPPTDSYEPAVDAPALTVFDVTDDWEDFSFGQDRALHKLTVEVRGTTATGSTAPTLARKLIGDIHKAMVAGGTWGDLTLRTRPVSDAIEVQEADRKVGGVVCTFEVEYLTVGYSAITQG